MNPNQYSLHYKAQQKLMNQEVRKIIKSSFCPKEKWVLDKDVQNCFKCDKKFHPLYRRKHHCRYCGQIFCNVCSDFFFDGKDLGEQEKQVRMCNACYQKCWKYIVKHDQSYIQFRKSNDGREEKIPVTVEEFQIEKSSSFTEQDKISEIKMILNEYSNADLVGIKDLQEIVQKKFLILMQVMMKDRKIPLKYMMKLLQIVKEVVSRCPPNALITNNMDVCKNIKFKCFHAEKQFEIELDSKMLIKKNFQSKKIKEQYEDMNCILVYGGLQSADLVGGEKQASFEEIVNNRTKQMSKLISYCQRLGISIIFLEGNIEKECDDKFFNAGIIVIPKIKIDHLYRLKVGLNIEKIVNSAHQLYTYTKQEIVGMIREMVSVTETSIKDTTKTKKFFAIKSVKDELGMTINIRGNNRELIQTIKKELNPMIMLLRHMMLKVHKVLLDQQLLNSMSQQIRNDCYLKNPEMFFNFYNEYHSDILNYLKEKYLSYKFISYTGSDFQNYPEVTKPLLQAYLQSRGHSFRNRWDYFTEICGEIRQQHRRFYSEDDMPVGLYLLKKFTGIDKKCQTCSRPNYHHIDIYYSTDHYLKIWTESRIMAYEKSTVEEEMILEEEEKAENQIDTLFYDLSKTSEKCQMQCFIECNKCQEVLSSKIKLTRQHLQYSMIAFVNHFFKGTVMTDIRQNNEKKSTMGKQIACNHSEKLRVIEMGEKSIKIEVGRYTLNRLCVLTDTGRKNYLEKKETNYCLQYCLLQVNRIDQLAMFLLDEVKGAAQVSKNAKFDRMIRDPRASFIRARTSIIGNPNVRLSQAQCLQMILPQLIEQITKINAISGVLLNPKKVSKFLDCQKIYYVMINYLKQIYIILIELKKSIKRRQLQMKYEAKDFENDFMMEEIDINSINDSSSVSQLTDNESDINKSQMMSTNQDNEKSEVENYQWLQPLDQVKMSRNDRKTVYNRRIVKATEQQTTQTFKQVSSFLRVEPAYLDFVPCYPHLPQTVIASCLNSQIHKQCINNSISYPAQLLFKLGSILETPYHLQNDQFKKIQNVIEIHERMFDIAQKVKKNLNPLPHQITFLYPNEFEMLRRKDKISIELFIESVAGAESWLASGGKSGSPFMRSFNDLLVIKKVTMKEFLAFKKFLPEYFTHLHEGSLLVPIYGAYIVNKSSTSSYYIVMKNLFFGMKDWYLYDMKGSVTRRFSKWPTVPLDVNFLIDRNSEPIFCRDNILQHLSSTLDYLVKNNIVDYSLILVVEIDSQKDYYMDGNRFQIGIIDYLREFGTVEKAQRFWKGSECTVQQPIDYRGRMFKNLKKYFTQIPL